MDYKLPKEFGHDLHILAGYHKNTKQIIAQQGQSYNQAVPFNIKFPETDLLDFRSLSMYFNVLLGYTGNVNGTPEVQTIALFNSSQFSNVVESTSAISTVTGVLTNTAAITKAAHITQPSAAPGFVGGDPSNALSLVPGTSVLGDATLAYPGNIPTYTQTTATFATTAVEPGYVAGTTFVDNVNILQSTATPTRNALNQPQSLGTFSSATIFGLSTINLNAGDTYYLSFKKIMTPIFTQGTTTITQIANALQSLSSWPLNVVITSINGTSLVNSPATLMSFNNPVSGNAIFTFDIASTCKGPLGDTINFIMGSTNTAGILFSYTQITTAGVSSSQIALPRNIESMIDRIDVFIGNEKIVTDANQYGTLFNDFLNQNTSLEYQVQRSVFQNAGPIQTYPNTIIVNGAYTANFTTPRFHINKWLGFLDNREIIDMRILPQLSFKMYFAQPTIMISQGSGPAVPNYSIQNAYVDIDILKMPKRYYEMITQEIQNSYMIPYMNWYTTEKVAIDQLRDYDLNFEANFLTELVAIIRSSLYQQQATIDSVTGNSSYFKFEQRGLGQYVWNMFGKNYPEYFIHKDSSHSQLMKARNKHNKLNNGTLYNTLSQFQNGYFSIHQSFENVGCGCSYISGKNTKSNTTQINFLTQNSIAPSDGNGYSLFVFAIVKDILKINPNREYEIIK